MRPLRARRPWSVTTAGSCRRRRAGRRSVPGSEEPGRDQLGHGGAALRWRRPARRALAAAPGRPGREQGGDHVGRACVDGRLVPGVGMAQPNVPGHQGRVVGLERLDLPWRPEPGPLRDLAVQRLRQQGEVAEPVDVLVAGDLLGEVGDRPVPFRVAAAGARCARAPADPAAPERAVVRRSRGARPRQSPASSAAEGGRRAVGGQRLHGRANVLVGGPVGAGRRAAGQLVTDLAPRPAT